MNDIQITRDHKILFYRQLYHDSEILMAKCFNFDINIDTGIITCDPMVTSLKAIKAFIELTFRNFSESPLENNRKMSFYMQVQVIQNEYNKIVDAKIAKLPYAEKFYAHQHDTLREAFFKKNNFLALDMGLGKTILSATLSRLWQCKRTVIICPASVKWNWFSDLTKKFGFNELFFTILDATRTRNIKAFNERFVIVNYDILGKMNKEINSAPIDHFILDEATYIKSHTSLRYKALAAIIEQHPNARITLLSGTPIKNRVNDVFAYLKLIRHELGLSLKKFLDEYTLSESGRGGSRVTGGRNLNDLHSKLSNFMIRKTKEECLDLPEKIFFNYKFELEDYRADYDKIIKELSEQKEISSLTGNLHSLNIIASKAKMKGIIELAEDILSQGKKVVIFGGYKEPLGILQEHFKDRCVKVDGSVDPYERHQRVERFQNTEECDVFLGNMIAAGMGINLTSASDVIFLNFPFTPAELYQSIDRLNRIGQKNCVNVHYTFAEGTIDEYIHDMILDKEIDANTVIDQGKDVVLRENMIEVLIKKLLNREDVKPVEEKKIDVSVAEKVLGTTIVKNPLFELPEFE